MAKPPFEQRAVLGGYRARIALGGTDEYRRLAGWHQASTRNVAEQAAAAEMMELVRQSPDPLDSPREYPEALHVSAVSGADPRALLNELMQKGTIRDFGYEETGCTGPTHTPVFTMFVWVRPAAAIA